MSLPIWNDLKGYQRIPSDAEQAVCEEILADAKAGIEAYVGYPILAVTRSYDIKPSCHPVYGNPHYVLVTPSYPMAFSDAIAEHGVEDDEATEVLLADLEVFGHLGVIRMLDGTRFTRPWYRITAAFGWSTHPEYARRIESQFRRLILETASDFYQRRNPNLGTQSSGGGVSDGYVATDIPERIKVMAREVKPPRMR
jgi:hypothetical protein